MPKLFDGNGVIKIQSNGVSDDNQGFDSLCAAVVHQAVIDYRNWYMRFLENGDDDKIAFEVRKLEAFFRSERFSLFSDLNADTIINKVRRIAKQAVAAKGARASA